MSDRASTLSRIPAQISVKEARYHGYNGRNLKRVESSYDSGCWRPGLAAKIGNMFFIWQE